jgi:hypothetical protein
MNSKIVAMTSPLIRSMFSPSLVGKRGES